MAAILNVTPTKAFKNRFVDAATRFIKGTCSSDVAYPTCPECGDMMVGLDEDKGRFKCLPCNLAFQEERRP